MYARYTEYLADLMKNPQTSELLNKALSTYPLYTPQAAESIDLIPNREQLNNRLLKAYKYREIGFETVGRFLDELETTMCEIMPYYNELYKTVEIMAGLDNPFDNVDIIETFDESKNGSGTNTNKLTKSGTDTTDTSGESNTTGTDTTDTSSESLSGSETSTTSNDSSTTNATVSNLTKNVHSDTPQNSIGITANNIDSVQYADSVSWNKSDNTDNATTTGSSSSNVSTDTESSAESKTTGSHSADTTTSEKSERTTSESSDLDGKHTTTEQTQHTYTKKGNQGVNTYAHDMIEFRTSIIDVTNQIINDERISELFMRVF